MILKGNQRGNAAKLASHLMNTRDNEHIELHELRGFMSEEDLHEALKESEAIAQTQHETEPMTRQTHRNRNAEVDFKGEKRSNATHASVPDPDARLYKKSPGTGAVLCFMGHALMENRHGFVVQGDLTHADVHAERKAALDMVHRHSPGSTRQLTLGADKGYDAAGFVTTCVKPASRPMSPRNRDIQRSTVETPGMQATPYRSSTESGSRKLSAGPRPSAAWRKPFIAASNGCDPASS